ncbi:MAG: response regulator [Nitrospirota bacterium]|nr:response regulator [Nitrospirota bacterium]MDE3035043.1 response regulator [Nitrospirota bacterium]MDE3118981.1 response regulator [Nitrospirota bacterium]MDE3224506.1 response regulator [Nitrospirota bacterium]MDE3243683.1 response regulator [Nitrospirota bacterium]
MAKPTRMLLAEDNPEDVELVLAALADVNLAGKVAVVHDGQEALDYLFRRDRYAQRSQENPAVVLLDLKMPKLDGHEVLRAIRAAPTLRAVPVVMLTSSYDEREVSRSYELGANAYVVKPQGFQAFRETVARLGVFWGLVNEPPPGSVANP